MHKPIRAEKWTIMILVQFVVLFFGGFGGWGKREGLLFSFGSHYTPEVRHQWQWFSTAKFIFPILKSLDIQNVKESQSAYFIAISLQPNFHLLLLLFYFLFYIF
jgi:hypothetical protein